MLSKLGPWHISVALYYVHMAFSSSFHKKIISLACPLNIFRIWWKAIKVSLPCTLHISSSGRDLKFTVNKYVFIVYHTEIQNNTGQWCLNFSQLKFHIYFGWGVAFVVSDRDEPDVNLIKFGVIYSSPVTEGCLVNHSLGLAVLGEITFAFNQSYISLYYFTLSVYGFSHWCLSFK